MTGNVSKVRDTDGKLAEMVVLAEKMKEDVQGASGYVKAAETAAAGANSAKNAAQSAAASANSAKNAAAEAQKKAEAAAANAIKSHTGAELSSSAGVHGARYTKDGKLEVRDESGVWHTVYNPYKVYGAVIDESESDPDAAVSYTGAAVGISPKSDEWETTEIFSDIRPCVFRDGKVQCYLDKNNFKSQPMPDGAMFDDECDLIGKYKFTQIVQAEDADCSTPKTAAEGYVKQTGAGEGYDRGSATTVAFKNKNGGYMTYHFNLPASGKYYVIIRFSSRIDERVRAHEIEINDGGRKYVVFPQKGMQWMKGESSWAPNESKYKFQFCTLAADMNAGANTVKVYSPHDLGENVATVEIDYIAAVSIDTPDTLTGVDRVEVSPYVLADSIEEFGGAVHNLKSMGLVNERGAQSVKIVPRSNTAAQDGTSFDITVPTDKVMSIGDYPILKFTYDMVRYDKNNPFVDICAYVTMKGGYVTRVWGACPTLTVDGTKASFTLDLRTCWNGGEDIGNNGRGDSLADIDLTKPITKFRFKPWHTASMKTTDSFNLRCMAFYRTLADAAAVTTELCPNGDCMIEIPKTGYRLYKEDGRVHVEATRDPDAAGFSYDAFRRGDQVNDYIYIAAYKACLAHGRLRSLTGQDCSLGTDNRDFANVRSLAEALGGNTVKGYGLLTFFAYNLLACLSLLYNKTLKTDCRTQPITGTPDAMCKTSGTADTYGMISRDTSVSGYKFAGIENLVNNTYAGEYFGSAVLEGVKFGGDLAIYTATKDYSKAGSWEKAADYWHSSDEGPYYSSGYFKSIRGDNLFGFSGDKVGASGSTYFGCFGIYTNGTCEHTYFAAPYSNYGLGCISLISYYEANGRFNGYFHNLHLMYSAQ